MCDRKSPVICKAENGYLNVAKRDSSLDGVNGVHVTSSGKIWPANEVWFLQHFLSLSLSWSFSAHLELSPEYQMLRLCPYAL